MNLRLLPAYAVCRWCDREIREDARSRSGWTHLEGGANCGYYATPGGDDD